MDTSLSFNSYQLVYLLSSIPHPSTSTHIIFLSMHVILEKIPDTLSFYLYFSMYLQKKKKKKNS